MTGKPIRRGVKRWVRIFAKDGWSPERIAAHLELHLAAVRDFLGTVSQKERWARGTERQIRGRIGLKVRELDGRGLCPRDIAKALDLSTKVVRDFLSRCQPVRREQITRPRTRREQKALERNERERLKRQARATRFVDEWKAAALTDPSYRDPVAPPVVIRAPVIMPAIAAAELVHQADAGELPRTVEEDWGSPHGGPSGPRKITAAVLAEALELRQAGWSWPAIARKFRVHRMSFFHALRR